MSDEVSILFAGDIYAGETIPNVSPAIRALASEVDLVSVNLEGPLTDRGEPFGEKPAHLRSTTRAIEVLRALSTDVACLANNHITDWGPEGLSDTLAALSGGRITAVGAGQNRAHAETPAIMERGGLSIGLLAYGAADIETVAAGEHSFGCAIIDESRMCDAVMSLRASVDVVVVQLHWGGTNYHFPFPEQLPVARSLVEAGAALVVGHHPHVIQGFERYGDGVIFYSLGNLVFKPYLRHGHSVFLSRENRASILAIVRVGRQGVGEVAFRHTRLDRQGTLGLVEGRPADRRDRLLHRLSKPLPREDYAAVFRRYCLRRMLRRGSRWLHPRAWRNVHPEQVSAAWSAVQRIIRPPR